MDIQPFFCYDEDNVISPALEKIYVGGKSITLPGRPIAGHPSLVPIRLQAF